MRIYSKTDTGKVRTTNQDSFFAAELEENVGFAVVCDGMGGAAAGNIASEMAAKHISHYIENSYRSDMSIESIEKTVINAIMSANIELYDASVNDSQLLGMGTTVVLVFLKDNTAITANVGDSRVYLLNDKITQLTRDHSIVQTLIENGEITPEDAKSHPRKNVITRALGAEEMVAVDVETTSLSNDDTLLLCTDGLTNYVEPEDILKIYKSTDIANVVERLITAANSNGGGDNITAVTVTV